MTHSNSKPTLVLGGTGKTGRRVVQGLRAAGAPVRVGSRSATPPFDWDDETTWPAALEDAGAVYITYQPDLLAPEALGRITALSQLAVEKGARRLVLLSGRGEEEAQACEEAVKASGGDWTVLRANWFAQNFSESFLLDAVQAGVIAVPARGVREPFVDLDDLAAVAVEALLNPKHVGQTYELSGPELLTFDEAAAILSRAARREIRFQDITLEEFGGGLRAAGVPEGLRQILVTLMSKTLDGRNASLTDGVQRVLGRPPRSFAEYAAETADSGVWDRRPVEA